MKTRKSGHLSAAWYDRPILRLSAVGERSSLVIRIWLLSYQTRWKARTFVYHGDQEARNFGDQLGDRGKDGCNGGSKRANDR